MRFFCSFALIVTVSLSGSAWTRADETIEGSSNLDQQPQQWSLLVIQGKILSNLRGYLEVQPRTDLKEGSLDRILIRPALFYALCKEVTLWAGYATVGAFEPSTSWEHRFWQQFQHEKNFGGIIVINRSRFEERLLPEADSVGLRVRHMLRTLIPVNDRRAWAVVFSDEVFFNFNAPTASIAPGYDQNRAFAGINATVAPNLRLEWGYMNNHVNLVEPKKDRMNHIGLLFLNYTFR